MRKYENECRDCAVHGYPCRGATCPHLNVLHVLCDGCGHEDDEMYCYDGKDYCVSCLLKALEGNGMIEQVDFDDE